MVAMMNAGFPAGGFLGGMVSAQPIASEGWRSIFILGGVLPLLLVVILVLFLPESALFKADRAARTKAPADAEKAMALIRRLAGRGAELSFEAFDWSRPEEDRVGLSGVLASGRLAGSLLLWAAFFCSLILFYGLVSWLPTILSGAGLSQENAIIVAAILNLGAIAGGIGLAWLADRFGPVGTIASNYVFAAVVCIVFGFSVGQALPVLLVLSAVLGFRFGGGQIILNAFASAYYPTPVRSSGVGAAMVAGRAGSLTGPLLGGALIGAGLGLPLIFSLMAIPALATGAAVGAIKTGGSETKRDERA